MADFFCVVGALFSLFFVLFLCHTLMEFVFNIISKNKDFDRFKQKTDIEIQKIYTKLYELNNKITPPIVTYTGYYKKKGKK